MKGWDKESLRHSAAKRFGKAPPYRGKKKIINPLLKFEHLANVPHPLITSEVKDYYRISSKIENEIRDLERSIKILKQSAKDYKAKGEIKGIFSYETAKESAERLSNKLKQRKRFLEYLQERFSYEIEKIQEKKFEDKLKQKKNILEYLQEKFK